MRKRLAVFGVAGVMAFVLSACFALQGFVILDGSLAVGQTTKAQFTVRPLGPGMDPYVQFFLVGRDNTDLVVGKGVWGTNGNFGGPTPLSAEGALASALNDSDDCNGTGLDFAAVYPNYTWKGFATTSAVTGNVNKTSVVDITLKVANASDGDLGVGVVAVNGAWSDDGDGNPEATDGFVCLGNAVTSVYIKPAA